MNVNAKRHGPLERRYCDRDESVASKVMTMASQETDPEACCGGATNWIDSSRANALARRLAAAADPIRLQVLSVIANAPGGEVCACDFVEPLGKSQPTISHHLKVLSEAGIVEGDRRGRWIWYRLTPAGLDDLAGALSSVGITLDSQA